MAELAQQARRAPVGVVAVGRRRPDLGAERLHQVGVGGPGGVLAPPARPVHERFGIQSSTRASFYLYTKPEEIDALVDGLGFVRDYFKVS